MMEAAYLSAIPSALIAVDRKLIVQFINPAAESLLSVGAPQAIRQKLSGLPGFTPELCELCERVFASGESVTLFEQILPVPFHHRSVTLHVVPVAEPAEQVLIVIDHAEGIDRLATSQWKQETTRAAGVMAAMLAHEVKNPLSGIRGAAQLLKTEVVPEHRALAELICMETDRIRDLLAQVEIFSDAAPQELQPVNIHEALQYVIQVAKTSFAQSIAIKERYDPSLPMVLARRDLLVQLFMNLIKNAAEALEGRPDAAITITTAYRSGYRMQGEKTALPVAVIIEDNGPGVPTNIREHLFEPFVSSKEEGRGLGLAIIAKIASDLGAIVELDKEFEGGTRFTAWLAVAS